MSQADCPLVKLRERQFVVRSFETRDVKRPVGLTVLLLAGALGGFVLNEARGSDSTVERIGNYGLGGLGGFLAAGAIWMIIDCKGRWGSDDCRD